MGGSEAGTDAFTISNAGYGLYLAVHRFSYEISIQEEYMTIYSSQGKRERVHRYKAKVVVHDTYDFTRLSSWKSFGGAMNNLAYYYDKIIGGNDYEWWATFEHTTDWEKISEYLRC